MKKKTNEKPQMKSLNTDPRHWLIELLCYWQGGVNATNISNSFELSRIRAQAILNQYRSEFNTSSLIYNESAKRFEPTEGFHYQLISFDVNEYLNWLTGIRHGKHYSRIQHEAINHPQRLISPAIIRPLVIAVQQRKRVDVDYLSVSSASTEGRIIAPHTFVNTGFRWHLRAWCEKSAEYRDFVLSRFHGEPEIQDGKSEHGIEQDLGWNTEIGLIIKPDPRLTPAQAKVLESDYLMQQGQLIIKTRAALAQYTLQSLQVSHKILDANPAAQQLILANYDQVKAWLF